MDGRMSVGERGQILWQENEVEVYEEDEDTVA